MGSKRSKRKKNPDRTNKPGAYAKPGLEVKPPKPGHTPDDDSYLDAEKAIRLEIQALDKG